MISVDTFRADIAKMCVEEHGVAIINDISAGSMDDRMMPVVAKLGVPYIMMHMKGTPQDMQKNPEYDNVVKEGSVLFLRKGTEDARPRCKRYHHRPGIRFR